MSGNRTAAPKGSTFIALDSDDEIDGPSCSPGGPIDPVSSVFMECVHEASALDKRRIEMLERATQAIRSQSRGFAEAVVAKMTAVGQRQIVVIDNAVKPDTVRNLYGCLVGDHFKRTEFARPDTRQFRHHITEYNVDSLRNTELTKVVRALARICFPRPIGDPLESYRMYTNAVHFGDVAFVHRDASDNTNVTVIVYPNPEWRPEYGGETMFYDESGEIIECIEPREGRVVLFHGSILHKGSPPGRLFHESRYTTAFKFSPESEQQQRPQQRESDYPEPQ